jgi:hypothetical protein
MGYMRIQAGHNLLGIEGEVAWATPGAFTIHNFPCSEDGKNCNEHKKQPAVGTHFFQDPSTNVQAVLDQRRRLFGSSTTTQQVSEAATEEAVSSIRKLRV